MSGMNGADIYWAMHANPSGAGSLWEARNSSHRLEVAHLELAKWLGEARDAVDTAWKGAGADGAKAAFTPLIEASEQAAEGMNRARYSMNDQGHLFVNKRENLQHMSKTRPDDSNGIIDLISITATDEEIATAAWDSANKHNIQVYEEYRQGTQPNQSQLKLDYQPPQVKPGGSVTEVAEVSGVSSSPGDVSVPNTGGGYSGIPAPTGGSYSAPAGYNPPPMQRSTAPPPTTPPPSAPPQQPAQQAPAANWQPGDNGSTSSAGYMPPSGGGFGPGYGPSGGYPSGGFGPSGSSSYGSGGYGSGGYGSGGYGSGGYSGGSFGPRGSSSGGYGSGGFGPRGSSAGTPTGSGRSTGAAPAPGSSAAPRSYGAPSSSSSSSSTTGRAPMMGGGGRGQGDGDEEHERKFVLPNDDPDSIFGGVPEGVTVVPPVIGE